jgi:hypothetical protein
MANGIHIFLVIFWLFLPSCFFNISPI